MKGRNVSIRNNGKVNFLIIIFAYIKNINFTYVYNIPEKSLRVGMWNKEITTYM